MRDDRRRITRALVSVYDKTGLVELATAPAILRDAPPAPEMGSEAAAAAAAGAAAAASC